MYICIKNGHTCVCCVYVWVCAYINCVLHVHVHVCTTCTCIIQCTYKTKNMVVHYMYYKQEKMQVIRKVTFGNPSINRFIGYPQD